MDADGSNPRQFTEENQHNLHNPAWSPDGQWLAARKGTVSRRSIPTGRITLVGGTAITMRDADNTQEIVNNAVILVKDNRIEAVFPKGEQAIPADAQQLDITGKVVIPGLIDAHAHGGLGSDEITPQQKWMQYSNLAFGVTTIHDPSNDTTEIFAHGEMQRADKVLGPRTFSTGTILYGATSEVNNLEDARFHIQRLKAAGAISVKSYNQLGRAARQQTIEAAAENQIMVVPEGGMKFQHNLNQLVDGHTSIEHALPIAHVYDDVDQLWQAIDTGYVPTFVVSYGGISGENYWYDRTDVWRNDVLCATHRRSLLSLLACVAPRPQIITTTTSMWHAPPSSYGTWVHG